jgi:phosphohistidine phosphatase SixA
MMSGAGTDPHLSAAGEARAELLATLLRDADLTHIHSTDTRRTRGTAGPVAAATGLEIAMYDPDSLGAFSRELRTTPGRHLVVGHSDTTPELVRALGGDPRGEIQGMEYDRLYVLFLVSGGVETLLLRFGAVHESTG